MHLVKCPWHTNWKPSGCKREKQSNPTTDIVLPWIASALVYHFKPDMHPDSGEVKSKNGGIGVSSGLHTVLIFLSITNSSRLKSNNRFDKTTNIFRTVLSTLKWVYNKNHMLSFHPHNSWCSQNSVLPITVYTGICTAVQFPFPANKFGGQFFFCKITSLVSVYIQHLQQMAFITC